MSVLIGGSEAHPLPLPGEGGRVSVLIDGSVFSKFVIFHNIVFYHIFFQSDNIPSRSLPLPREGLGVGLPSRAAFPSSGRG